MRRVFFAAVFGVCAFQAALAVPVDINSGNPAFPFPQFLPYAHPNGDTLQNLATKNPAGVVHAEMEKSIRDAYQIMMNRAEYAEIRGRTGVGGTKYIKYLSIPYCSEGDGYAMLAAAMMADKTTFDGLWLHNHDLRMNKVVRYGDGSNAPAYNYSVLPGVYASAGENSAADGDFDIAIALMVAHAQWGDLMGINDSRGNPISYKNDFIKVIKGLSDTLVYKYDGVNDNNTLVSGDIGLDGYFKGGDSWAELSGWAASAQNLASIGVNNRRVEQAGGAGQYVDYTAPAYFRQFAEYLKQENARTYAWNISQFERAEASSDWLIGKHMQNSRSIPIAGWVRMDNDTTPVFSSVNEGEDFRWGWRNVLNYVWHGNPKDSWDPVRHIVVRDRANTYQRDMGLRFSRFLWDRQQDPWKKSCETISGQGVWWGPSMVRWHYSPQGDDAGEFPLNWVHGTGSPSAVTAQDTNLMAEMYRQCEIEWGVEEPGDRYLTSTPTYFHGFFRLLGMNVLTGNHHAPMNMKRGGGGGNMKVYLDVDKTYAFEDDTITYTIDYRNYGADTARGVVITNRLHNDMVYVPGSSTGGGAYDAASNSVRWNIGAVSGFKTSTGVNPTRGTVSFKVIIPNANLKRYENRVQITCTNGSGWTSNEYPNKISSVMKRNGVDIARRALRVGHSVYRDTVNPGMNATYTINFENSAEAGWLNGGRPGVNFSYAHNGTAPSAGSHTFMLRAFNDAHEAYIDYGNYRVSYFLFDNSYSGLGGTNGWNVRTDILYVPDSEKPKFKLLHENITEGQDTTGKWNQRLILQIADVLDPSRTDTNWNTMAAPTQFLINYSGLDQRVHRGISTPFKGVWAIYTNYTPRNWGGDWSYNPRATGNIATDAMADWGYPVTPDFTEDYDPDYQGKPVTSLHRKLCGAPPSTTVDNILIEEWDGYTWRRVFGNGPVPGREVNNVVIRDTLPNGVTFQNFIGPYPFDIEPEIDGRVITWKIPKLLVGQGGKIQYAVTANTPAGTANVRITSRAWASADRESPISASAVLVVTRDSLPPLPPPPSTIYKRADKAAYLQGDTINYTIAYKQTHGYPVKSAARDEWAGTGSGTRINNTGDTISFNGLTDMYHKLTYGTNGTLGGTALSASDQEFHIFARSDVSGSKRVDITFKRDWGGIYVTVASNGQPPIAIQEAYGHNDGVFNYKLVFRRDSLHIWIGDTSKLMPTKSLGGIPEQAGYAGVKYTNADYGFAKLVNWSSHFDLAYNVTIRDTIPWGVSYIDGSAAGQINTGALVPRTLTGTMANGVITWPVVSGLNIPSDALGANDSLTVTWKGVVDTAKNGMIINTAYADLASYPKDSIGAQLRSRFTLDGAEPPDTGNGDIDTTEPPPPILGVMGIWADRPSCIYTDALVVTLSAVPSGGAVIYYTSNGQSPDMPSAARRRYDGPITLYADNMTDYTLKAFADDTTGENEPSDVITRVYSPLRTVPARSAIFYDDAGDGFAHGVKVVLDAAKAAELNLGVVRSHAASLVTFPGMPEIRSELMRVDGDTLVIPFSSGVNPALDTKLTITKPTLPGSSYASEHGYLADAVLTVVDGVAPVITRAVYDAASNADSVILIVTFNKRAEIDGDGEIVPFTLSYGQGANTYELRLKVYGYGGGNTVYFLVVGMDGGAGRQGADLVQKGDSIRINAANGYVLNSSRFAQTNERNRAVALDVLEPEFSYEVKMGPSPFGAPGDSLRIWLSVKPYSKNAFDALGRGANVRIFDMMGNVVAVTGKNLIVRPDPQDASRYLLVWKGTNRSGRLVGTGVYVVHVVLTDGNENKRTFRQKVYLRSR